MLARQPTLAESLVSLSILLYRSVFATPGWQAKLSTPVPARRRLNSLLLMMLKSLVRPYMCRSEVSSFVPLHVTAARIS